MAPTPPHTASQLKQLIYYHLDNNLGRNALFLAQRLVAYEGTRNAEAVHLLAYTQYQCGYIKGSWDTSRSIASKGSHLGCSYVFAQACLELGRFVDGLNALEKCRTAWQYRNTFNQHSESRRQHIPDAAAILCLKGKLWKGHKNMNEAVQCWVQSLRLNPFMWDAYTLLVDSGAKISIPAIYKLNPDLVNAVHAEHTVREEQQERPQPQQSAITDPFVSTQRPNGHSNALYEKFNIGSRLNVNTANAIHDDELIPTPSTVMDTEDSMVQQPRPNNRYEIPAAPLRKPKSTLEAQESASRSKSNASRLKSRFRPTAEESTQDTAASVPPVKRTVSGITMTGQLPEPVRRTTRSQTSRPPSAASSNKLSSVANSLGLRQERDIKRAKAPAIKPRTATAATVGRAVSGNRIKPGPNTEVQDPESRENRQPSTQPTSMRYEAHPEPDLRAERDVEALKALLDLFHRIASAHYSLQHYDCQNAISIFNSLSSSQRETPYILAQIARAYNEMSQHTEAEKYFIRVKQLAPSRLEDMEIYSTVLYQLKSDIELAYLAHELVEVERNSPQTWIAIGNSFSLQRDHEQALKCFRRATQLDPTFAYAFTLQGHEYIENEEFPKALESYRCAIAADNRHYNAWYGLGKVYSKLGKYKVAESHYRTAASINPSNAVLTCAIGAVMEKTKPLDQALRFYDRACRLAPTSALSRFKKAKALMGLGRPDEALIELELLKEIAPDEANVWFLSGRLCKMLGKRAEAVKAFTVALNLDPKAAQFIKDAMESLDDDDDDFDGDEDME